MQTTRRRPKRLRARRPSALSVPQILEWADAHFERTGRWPNQKSGHIPETAGETWGKVNKALDGGFRGLAGGSSLPQLLSEYRGKRNAGRLPALSEEQIIGWAGAFRLRKGRWPMDRDGPIEDAPGETWTGVNSALAGGHRGLAGGSTLARLLAQRLGVRNRTNVPRLTVEKILAWADAYHRRHDRWPDQFSGPVDDHPGETWAAINDSLVRGYRGLCGGSTVRKLLAQHRNVRHRRALPKLSIDQILAWADRHHERTGVWPNCDSGPVVDAPGETWHAVSTALNRGRRGLRRGSLARLLKAKRGIFKIRREPTLSIGRILEWADLYFAKHGVWPTKDSGKVEAAPRHTWFNVDACLRHGYRGLEGGTTLLRVLELYRRQRHPKFPGRLTVGQIVAWAKAHYRRTGRWPNHDSGPLPEVPGERWSAIDQALINGHRGLRGGTSLARLLNAAR
ncbi:MAG TPA: hypothetical protein VGX78_04740 [Pirellulales bacterium]|nr:hypothetical protein [Pirellulales bacterium]